MEPSSGINSSNAVRRQYGTADRLNIRISIHSKYSTNKQGFGNWIASHYQIREGMSVLELGCGTGDMWTGKQEIVSRCSRFILSDFSEGMLDKAKETLSGLSGIEYRLVDIQEIPFGDHEFDVVIANMMLYHVPDLPRGLREVRRVLKEEGTFCCATYGENGMMAYIAGLFPDQSAREQVNSNFTLQIEITDVDDMVDYIRSLTGMSDLQKLPPEEIRAVLQAHMRGGILRVPKEYGMFIAGA